MKKCLFVLLLVLCMVLSPLPMTVLADVGMQNETSAESAEPTSMSERTDAVQAHIDALPDASTITADNAEYVIAQLETIDAEKLALSSEARALVDFTRYDAAIAALNALEGMANAGVPEETAESNYRIEYGDPANGGRWDRGRNKFSDALKLISQNAGAENMLIRQNVDDQTVSGNQTMPKTTFSIIATSLTFKGTLTVPAGATVTIRGYGSSQSTCTVKEIKVETGGRLNIENVTLNGPINITGIGVVNVKASAVVNGDVYNYGLLNNDDGSTGIINGTVTNDGGWIYNGTFNGTVNNNAVAVNNGTIIGLLKGGTYNGNVTNKGTIESNTTFNNTVNNYGTIEGGTFTTPGEYSICLYNYSTGVIENGTFNKAVQNYGLIKNGSFQQIDHYAAVTVENGTFNSFFDRQGNDIVVKNGSFPNSDRYLYGDNVYKVTFSSGTELEVTGMPAAQWRRNWPATKPTETPKRSDGQVLQYWYLEGDTSKTPYTFTENITSNITLVAEWTSDLVGFGQFSGAGQSKTYTGSEQKFVPIITRKDGTEITLLTEGTDYTVTGTRVATDVGTYTVTINGMGEYRGTLDITWTINPKNIEASNIELKLEKTEFDYNESTQTPTLIKKHNITTQESCELVSGKDYIAYGTFSATESGEYTITLIGKGNYTGTKTLTWKINQVAYDTSRITKPTLTATYGQTLADIELPEEWIWKVNSGTWDAKYGIFTPHELNEISVGNVGTRYFDATYIPNNQNYLPVVVSLTITVDKADLTATNVTAPTAKSGLIYNGQEQALIQTAATVPDGCTAYYRVGTTGAWVTDIAEIKGTDAKNYTVQWYVSGGSNYNDYGSADNPKTITAAISARDLNDTDDGLYVKIEPENLTYVGKPLNASSVSSVTLCRVSDNGVVVDLGRAALKFIRSDNGTNVGTYAATVEGQGNLTGTKQIEWKIVKADAPKPQNGTLEIYVDRAHTYTFDFNSILAKLMGEMEYGTIAYINLDNADGSGNEKLSAYLVADALSLSGSKLTIPIKAVQSGQQMYIGCAWVTVRSQNYKDFNLVLDVYTREKADTPVTVTGMPQSVIYGDTLTLAASQNAETGGTWHWTVDSDVFEILEGAESATVKLKAKKATNGLAGIDVSYKGDTHVGTWRTDVPVSPKEITITFTMPDVITYRDNYTIIAKANDVVGDDIVPITLTYTGTLSKDNSHYPATETKPTEAGTYNVVASTTNVNYTIQNGDAGEKNFVINKLNPTLTDVTAFIPLNSADLHQVTITHKGEAGEITPDDGQTLEWGTDGKVEISYTFTPTDKNVEVTGGTVIVTLGDTVCPIGEVSLGQSKWKEFLNDITFGLLFKDEQILKVTADDSFSGVAKIAYYESAEVLTQAQVMALDASDWNVIAEDENSASVTILAENGKKSIYYICLTDHAGNVTYLSTDGAIFDTAVPVITGVKDGGVYYTTQVITVTDDNPLKITINSSDRSMTASPYSCELDGNREQVYVITATDALGNSSTVTITMHRLSDVTDPLGKYSSETVTSDDRNDIEKIIETLEELLKSGKPSESEKKQITDAMENAEKLLDRIGETETVKKDLTDAVNSYEKDRVTSEDKEDITDRITEIDKLLNGENLTDKEKEELTEVRKDAQDLLNKIEDAASSGKTENIDKVKDTTADNVKTEDKKDLEQAKEELEKALDDYENNLTETEKKDIQNRIEQIDEALNAVEKVETVENLIGKLPDVITEADAGAIKKAEDAYNALTEHEKSLLDRKKLDDARAKLDKLNASDGSDVSKTDDSCCIWLWLVLLVVCCIVLAIVYRNQKKRRAK